MKTPSSTREARLSASDAAIAIAFCILAAGISYRGYSQFPDQLYDVAYLDVWFDADPPRVIRNLTAQVSNARTSVHPIFLLLVSPPGHLLLSFGVTAHDVGAAFVSSCGALTTLFLYLGLRGLGLPAPAAIVFTGVYLASATFIFWLCVVETFALSAVTISLMFATMALSRGQRALPWIAASSGTLAVTTTNWMLGLVSSYSCLPRRRFLAVSAGAFLLVSALALGQLAVYPASKLFFLPRAFTGELRFTQLDESFRRQEDSTLLAKLRSFVVFSAITPATIERSRGRLIVTNERSSIDALPLAGAAAWILLIVSASWGAVRNTEKRAIAVALAVYLVFQAALCAAYGATGFLYSANFFPALVGFSAFAYFTPLRPAAYAAAVAFILIGGYHNVRTFDASISMISSIFASCPAVEGCHRIGVQQ